MNLKDSINKGHALKPPMQWPTYDGKLLDRSQFVTSSEVWNCPRRTKFEKALAAINGPAPFPNWGYAERGNLIEAWAVEMLTLAGHELLYAGEDQRSFYIGKQSGTPDGMEYLKRTGLWVYEFKSIDPRTNLRNLPKPAHIAQLQQNIDLVSHCLNEGIAGGSLLYIDASNLQKIQQYDLETDHDFAADLQRRAEDIMAAPSPAELPSEGMHTGDCDRCSFTAECSQLIAGNIADLQNAGKGVFK